MSSKPEKYSTTVLGMLLLLACFLIFEAYIYNNAKTSELNREPVFGREFEVDDEINWNHHQIELLNEKIDTLENIITKLLWKVNPLLDRLADTLPKDTSNFIQQKLLEDGVVHINNENMTIPSASSENTLLCQPEKLVGQLKIDMEQVTATKDYISELNSKLGHLFFNGMYTPKECHNNNHKKVAIIIPFRDDETLQRTRHFYILLNYLLPNLIRQNIEFGFFLIEQGGDVNVPFNRGQLLNAGFVEGLKAGFSCFFFHDVDLIPENDRNLYECVDNPRHYAGYIDVYKYKLMYADLYGGINAFTFESFIKINGYSNEYWGWGGEDDDLLKRVRSAGYELKRPNKEITKYKMFKHGHKSNAQPNPIRHKLIQTFCGRWREDGLTNLKYDVLQSQTNILFTTISVDLHYPKV